MRRLIGAAIVATAAAGMGWTDLWAMAQGGASAAGATRATPKPSVAYSYEQVQSTGNRSQYTQQWESVTATGSRVRVTGPKGIEIQINEHHVADDVMVLDRQSKVNA